MARELSEELVGEALFSLRLPFGWCALNVRGKRPTARVAGLQSG